MFFQKIKIGYSLGFEYAKLDRYIKIDDWKVKIEREKFRFLEKIAFKLGYETFKQTFFE